MTPDELKRRTKNFGLAVIRLCDTLPQTRSSAIVANQLIRSATSTGANYRAVCRARSDPDFVSKLGVTLEEADESVYWLEIILESKMKKPEEVQPLLNEGNEIVSILVASLNTIRTRMKSRKSNSQDNHS